MRVVQTAIVSGWVTLWMCQLRGSARLGKVAPVVSNPTRLCPSGGSGHGVYAARAKFFCGVGGAYWAANPI